MTDTLRIAVTLPVESVDFFFAEFLCTDDAEKSIREIHEDEI